MIGWREERKNHGPKSRIPISGFRWRSLTPDQARAIRAAHDGGARVPALAEAYDVSYRTIYRMLRAADHETTWLVWGDWQAMFEMTEDGPVQVTVWVPR